MGDTNELEAAETLVDGGQMNSKNLSYSYHLSQNDPFVSQALPHCGLSDNIQT